MPIKVTGGVNLVYCINHANHVQQTGITEEQSTMLEVNTSQGRGWFALTEVKPKSANTNSTAPTFMPGSGIPIKVYTCNQCGYCELYHGQILDRTTWS